MITVEISNLVRLKESEPTVIGERVKKARLALGLTQFELAVRIGVNLTQTNRLERGHSSPSSDTLASLARELGVSMDYLAGLTDDPNGGQKVVPLSDSEQKIIDAYRHHDWRRILHLLATDEDLRGD